MRIPIQERLIVRAMAVATVMLVAMLGHHSAAGAEDRPRSRNLVLAGMAMGVPTYALGVAMHEGSHALAGKLVGARVTDYSLLPGFHPRTGKFYFGYVTVFGLKSTGQRAFFLAAPKMMDTVMLGGFSALYATDSLPSNAYGTTAALVLATGFWVDFSKDILSFSAHNDTIKIYEMLGLDTELKRLPARLVHAGLSAAMGYAILQGYRDLFARDVAGASASQNSTVVLPMWDATF